MTGNKIVADFEKSKFRKNHKKSELQLSDDLSVYEAWQNLRN